MLLLAALVVVSPLDASRLVLQSVECFPACSGTAHRTYQSANDIARLRRLCETQMGRYRLRKPPHFNHTTVVSLYLTSKLGTRQ